MHLICYNFTDTRVTGRQFALLLWLTGLICLCTILDIVTLANLGNTISRYTSLETKPIDDLPFLSSYSHLDDIYKERKLKATPRGPTMQLPYSLTQVNSSAPEDTQEPYPDQFKAPASGMIPYNERRTIVTREVSVENSEEYQHKLTDFSRYQLLQNSSRRTTVWKTVVFPSLYLRRL